MTHRNLDIVRRQFESWTAGDFDAAADTFSADVVVIAPEGWPEGSVTEGIDAWRRQAERLRADWEHAAVEILELREAGDDRVFARIRYVTRGVSPGMSFDTPMSVAFWLEDGRVTRAHYFWDDGGALEVLGLA